MEDFRQPGTPAVDSEEKGQPGNGLYSFSLEDIRIKADMLVDLTYYLESAAVEAVPEPTSPSGKRLFSMIYILEEMLQSVSHSLEDVIGHIKVCDVVLAVSHVREMEQEISELREKLRSVEDAQEDR